MRLLMSSAVLLLFLLMHSPNDASGGSAAPQVGSVSPRWSADLRNVIGSAPIGVVAGGKGHEYIYKPKTSLWFTDNDTLVATFVTRGKEDSPKLSRRGVSDDSSPLHLRAVVLEVASGAIRATTNWPVTSRGACIVAAHDGKFVTQTGDDLTLYSSGLQELRKLRLPPAEESGWSAHASPSGKNIVFIASNLTTHSAVQWVWVEVDSLRIVGSWEEVQSGWVGISDSKIAMTTCVWFYGCEANVEVRGPDTEWKTVASVDRVSKPHPQFVNDNLLSLSGNPTRLIQIGGNVAFAENVLAEGCWWGGVFPSASGQRFVIPSCKLKGHFAPLDMGGYDVLRKILVYDAPFHGQPYIVDVKAPAIKDLTLLAVSPDGSKLAILNGESLYLFQLPALS